ncbi:hypothetical protein E2562_015791 [Oryza meyeriana var. granulata]|uniref:Uncharacterized protein n=1 Tax=Oryza meyeriana var. granulata TaxID=110450 RepID=A0A6G1D4H0_9ORYZ|nr:hypothetical protein E2562_015791 [Oryza meyeriana var. granulata]
MEQDQTEQDSKLDLLLRKMEDTERKRAETKARWRRQLMDSGSRLRISLLGWTNFRPGWSVANGKRKLFLGKEEALEGIRKVEDKRGTEAARANPRDDKLAALKAYRKAKGLCFTCGERWGRDHKCAQQI